MFVLILERVPSVLRGELSRWLYEPRAGVFVGTVNTAVRERLWEKAKQDARGGAGIMMHTANNEQGFAVEMFGDPTRTLREWEGIYLTHVKRRQAK